VERDPVRAERIVRNAARLGVPGLAVVTGAAPGALADLETPDAVFIGGGASDAAVELAWQALAGGGRLVVHAVTQETERLLSDCRRRLGGQLTRTSVEHLEPIGSYSGWKPARAVVQWSVQKPLGEP
jgi:precorrin-6Y C5,15-methyltransferase (decarboxylating)